MLWLSKFISASKLSFCEYSQHGETLLEEELDDKNVDYSQTQLSSIQLSIWHG